MKSNKVLKIAFVISLIAHGLCFALPALRIDAVQNKEEKDIEFQIEIEKPKLIPEINRRGEQKKYEEVEKKDIVKEIGNEEKAVSVNAVIDIEDEFEKILHVNKLDLALEKKIESVGLDKESMLRYQDMIKRRIQEKRRYPVWAKKQGLEGAVEVSFIVLSQGSIKQVNIMRSSGMKVFDEEAVSTIKRAVPFPSIPSTVVNQIQMQIRIVFNLDTSG